MRTPDFGVIIFEAKRSNKSEDIWIVSDDKLSGYKYNLYGSSKEGRSSASFLFNLKTNWFAYEIINISPSGIQETEMNFYGICEKKNSVINVDLRGFHLNK